MSVAAPGPVGTMSRIGQFGHDWAPAAEARAREKQQIASRRKIGMRCPRRPGTAAGEIMPDIAA